MKSEQSGLSLTRVALIACAGLGLYNYQSFTAHNSNINALQQSIGQLRALNKDLEKTLAMSKRKFNMTNPKDQGKYFNDDFVEAFNVIPTDHIVFPENALKALETFEYKNDVYYKSDPEGAEIKRELYSGYPAGSDYDRQVYVKWSGPKVGYGVYANMDLPEGQFLGDYTGVLVSDLVNTDYMWTYPVKEKREDGEEYGFGVDARHTGNMLRFVNDLTREKLNTEVVFYLRGEVWHVGYRTTKPIKKDEQLFVSYGDGYWKSRKMHDPTVDEDGEIEKD